MEEKDPELNRYKNLPKSLRAVFFLFSFCGIVLGVFFNFNLSFLGVVLSDTAYYFSFLAIFGSLAFITLPGRKKDKRLPWYDVIAAVLAFGICFYFFTQSSEISLGGWLRPSSAVIIAASVLVVLILEGGRRTAGPIYLIVCALLAFYPLYASHMPGLFWGRSYTVTEMMSYIGFSSGGLLGLITKVVAVYLLGFLVFAGVLNATGAGKFFMNIAYVFVGRYRGGPAKVAVLSSAFFGMLTGSATSNVVAVGSFTIPIMKKVGYPPHYAAAIEACASTGAILMPPVMGAIGFIMAEFLGMEYRDVIIAAAIPASLYYLGLLMQVDAYAAKTGLRGLSREETPSLRKTLAEGWPFLTALFFLIWGLVYMRWERLTPWYASGLMVLLSFYRRETRLTPKKMVSTLVAVGDIILRTTAIIMPIALVYSGLVMTGVTLSFASGLVRLGAENIFLVILMGVGAIYIMGMAGMVAPAYIFLSLTMVPAVLKINPHINVLALHLFIAYYAMLAPITLPVADSVFIAATIAGANPIKSGLLAMRLAIVIYFIPWFFLFNPALIMQGSPIEALFYVILCLIGIILIAGGCEGYLAFVGPTKWTRPLLLISGILIAFPEWKTTVVGSILALLVVIPLWITNRSKSKYKIAS